MFCISPTGGPDRAAGAQALYRPVYEVEGEPERRCVADIVFRYND